MTEPVRRVALLVRHGVAGERLRTLLAEAGIESVLQGDPTEIAVESLAEAGPEVVLVALDPDIEDALARFESVLGNPEIDVIYEEAELAAAREGWEAARWKRHLLAKLQGHDRVLPPRPEGSEDEPGLQLHSAAEVSDEDYAAFDPGAGTGIADAGIDADAPTQAATAVPELADAHEPATAPEPVEAAGMEIAGTQDGHAFDPVNAEAAEFGATDDGLAPVSAPLPEVGFDVGEIELDTDDCGAGDEAGLDIGFDAVEIELDADGGVEYDAGGSGGFEIVFDGDAGADDAPARGSRDDAVPGLDEHLLNLSPGEPADAGTEQDSRGADAGGEVAPDASAAIGAPAGGVSMSTSTFGELTLDDGSGSYDVSDDTPATDERFGRDLAELDQRIASLELVEEHAGDRLPGVVLVLAGIGGPDAVRQLLGALPADFPRPVLVQQRLDGGRYDRLVAQMQRATTLPVHLAEPGRVAMAGFVYVLSAGLGIEVAADGLRFAAEGEVLSALPSGDSAVLMLSGSDPADVDAVLKHRAGGALVAGQSPEGCYDPAAPDQLAARGGELAPPIELARRLADRWPA